MPLYIWKYTAKVPGGRGVIKGRVEAPSYSEAENRIKECNQMIAGIKNLAIDRSKNARLNHFEKWPVQPRA